MIDGLYPNLEEVQGLRSFVVSFYGENGYKKDLDFHLSQTDNEVTSAIRSAVHQPDSPAFRPAEAILNRKHFRLVYSYNPSDQDVLKESIANGSVDLEENQPFNSPAHQIWKLISKEFGSENAKKDLYIEESSYALFPVAMNDGRIEPSISLSPILKNFPLMNVDSVYVAPELSEPVKNWIERNREKILLGEIK